MDIFNSANRLESQQNVIELKWRSSLGIAMHHFELFFLKFFERNI
ncbi:MAG: hypothetical protein QE271_02400 [Bacteriovoracaceae bacterium]|nr:hypothetical protein [Bacteriovoracaceae bacterium]